tara:strand:- start:340 stop:870 length:531 start_codon:yes stop_codon:yes gene_type:complete
VRFCAGSAGTPLQTGVNQPGVSYQFHTSLPTQWDLMNTEWSWNRKKQARAGVQLPQSAYSPLLPPYVHFGLGQTNDFVEDFTVGLPGSTEAGTPAQPRRFAQAIIPNSRLIVIPYPYNASDGWSMQLFLAPRKQAVVGLVVGGCLLLLGLVIFTLEMRERMTDAIEKKKWAPALPL